MELIIIIVVVFIVAAVVLFVSSISSSARSATEDATPQTVLKYEYERKQFVMSQAENNLYHVLEDIVGDQYVIFPQIHLNTFLEHKLRNGQNWKGALATIQKKSVDFLICNKSYFNPIVAIELDDKSHQLPERITRDDLVNAICAHANMPLIHIPWSREYNRDELLRQLAPYLK